MSFWSQCSLARIERLLGGYYGPSLRYVPSKPPHSACKADAPHPKTRATELSARNLVCHSTHSGELNVVFDRDRFFFGPYLVSGPGRYEIGYLGEYARQFGKDSRMINAIMLSAQYNF